MNRIYLFLLALLSLSMFFSCDSASRISSGEKQSLNQLLTRISPSLQGKVTFEKIEPTGCVSVFELETNDAILTVRGNDLSSMTAGLSWYLKYYCNSGTYWGEHRNPIPTELPTLIEKIHKESPYKYRYYLNGCVYVYSSKFWKWDRWEREIDWMALNGVNLALVCVDEIEIHIPNKGGGVMRNVLAHYNIQEQDEGRNTLVDQCVELQQKIIKRMRELGIQPVLSGFTGYVPNKIRETIKTVEFVDGGIWQGTPKQPFIKIDDPFYKEFGKVFYEEQKKLYGDLTFIDAGPVGEGTPPEGLSFSDVGKQIQDLIFEVYPDATWVLGGWQNNPRPELLEKANKDRTLILDLWGETRPQWKRADRFDLYKQTPWVWNIINNFGGNNGLFGNLELIFNEPSEAMASEQGLRLCGLGAMMEGIENNPVVYHAVYESAWLDKTPNIDEWLKGYAKSRYGASSVYAEKAWSVLNKTVYHATLYQEGPSQNLMCARPGLDIKRVTCCGVTRPYYSHDSLLLAWDDMIKAARELGSNEAFQYDLVDLTRQTISNYAYNLYPEIVNVYKKNQMKKFTELSTIFLGLFDDLNNVLKTKKEFLVGPWIADARVWGKSSEQQVEFERQAKMIITTWGERQISEQGNLHDYSYREWEGIMLDLYKSRWETYFNLLSSTNKGQEPVIDWFDFDYSWVTNNKQYATEPVGNPVEACVTIYNKYRNQ